jgi:hypothetical protein
VDEDAGGRKEWETALTDGMDLLGIKTVDRTIPWAGACGVVHPMILEAAVRFQSKSITRLFPAEGPAQVKVIGESGQSKLAQAKRVGADINHWIVEKMPEYRDETEQLLFPCRWMAGLPQDLFRSAAEAPVATFVPARFHHALRLPQFKPARYCHVLKQAMRTCCVCRAAASTATARSVRRLFTRPSRKVTRLGGMSPGTQLMTC